MCHETPIERGRFRRFKRPAVFTVELGTSLVQHMAACIRPHNLIGATAALGVASALYCFADADGDGIVWVCPLRRLRKAGWPIGRNSSVPAAASNLESICHFSYRRSLMTT